MAVELYTPQFVQPFGTVKNSDVNTNLSLIRTAFNAMSAVSLQQGDVSIGADLVRNILVDLSTVAPIGFMVVTLPASPAVGDPPVRVEVVEGGYSSAVNGISSAQIVTSDGASIMGVVGNVSPYDGLPFLSNAGDFIELVFIGGTYGWVITRSSISTYITPAGILLIQQWDSPNLHCFHRLESVIDTSAIPAPTLSLVGINSPGLWSAFTITDGAGPQDIVTSSGAQTFNGTTGVFTMPGASPNIRYLFTCVATDHFEVTS